MSFKHGVLDEGSLRVADGMLRIDVQIPWYRSLPLSCIEGVAIAIDGEPLDLKDAALELDGQSYPLNTLHDHTDKVWFIQDFAAVAIPGATSIVPGERHAITARVATRIPYIIVGPGKALPTSVTVTKQLTAH